MIIEIKNNDTLIIDDFTFKCYKEKGSKKSKIEGDFHARRIFSWNIFWNQTRLNVQTELSCHNMGR